jgi:YqjK-like protein
VSLRPGLPPRRDSGRQALQDRRERLVARSRLLRADVVEQTRVLQGRFAGVEHAVGLARAATRKPVLLAAAAAALLVLKPARALRYITRGAMAVSLLRRVLGWMDREPR